MITDKDFITSGIYIGTLAAMYITGGTPYFLLTLPLYLWAMFGPEDE